MKPFPHNPSFSLYIRDRSASLSAGSLCLLLHPVSFSLALYFSLTGIVAAARAGLGGWDLRLQVRLGQTRDRRLRVRGCRPGLRSPHRAPTLLAAPSPYLVAMRLRRLALFPGLALLLAAARLAAASDVLELTDDNFESRITDTGSSGLMLVEFFAPW